jgi:hypothetical protein
MEEQGVLIGLKSLRRCDSLPGNTQQGDFMKLRRVVDQNSPCDDDAQVVADR